MYQVVWDGEPYPDFCSLRFSNGYAGLDNEWHICAEITYLKLECGKSEVAYYYAGDIQVQSLQAFVCPNYGSVLRPFSFMYFFQIVDFNLEISNFSLGIINWSDAH